MDSNHSIYPPQKKIQVGLGVHLNSESLHSMCKTLYSIPNTTKQIEINIDPLSKKPDAK
jgi:hypothetical protein